MSLVKANVTIHRPEGGEGKRSCQIGFYQELIPQLLHFSIDALRKKTLSASYACLAAEVPDALLVDAWAGFTHMGDGIHPDPKTFTAAAHRTALAIQRHKAKR
jgi:hypothetical protein